MPRDDYHPVVDALLDAGMEPDSLIGPGTGALQAGVGFTRTPPGMDCYILGPQDSEAYGLPNPEWGVAVAYSTPHDRFRLEWAVGLPQDEAITVMLLVAMASSVYEALESLEVAINGDGLAAL
jgi:hypothetical protein